MGISLPSFKFIDRTHYRKQLEEGLAASIDAAIAAGVDATGDVVKANYTANSILKADTNATPTALTVAQDTVVGRVSGGGIAALTVAQARALLGIGGSTRITRPNTTDLLVETYDETLGWVRSYYDSGVRNMATVWERTAGVAWMRRLNDSVRVSFDAFTSNGNGYLALASGFGAPDQFMDLVMHDRTSPKMTTIYTGALILDQAVAWTNVFGTTGWGTTAGVPASLPGVAV